MKLRYFILGFAALAFGGTAFWYFQKNGGSFEFASKKKSSRPLENSESYNKTSKVTDEPTVMLNDPAIAQAWGLKKIDASRAWELSKGSKLITVAVIDTGCDVKHEDLSTNYWINKSELPSNGIDDDGNGFVDDVYGWNFVSNNPDLTDNHGHGTHIAGIIGAEAGNNKGIAGISPQVSIMCLKYFDPKVPNTDNLKNTIQAIRYAIKMKAHIINYSGGGTEYSQDEKDAIEEARKNGILFVAAAGNEKSNSDKFKYYPADYGLDNIISVTAVDQSIQVLASSNYGTETVDIAAPGQNILSTLPNNSYGYMTGTSQATAFVTGAAVLVMAHKDSYNPDQVKKYILSTGDSDQSLLQKTRTSRKLNLFKSLAILDGGVSASGVVAANSEGLKDQFVGDPNSLKTDSPTAMKNFGQKLMGSFEKMPDKYNIKDIQQASQPGLKEDDGKSPRPLVKSPASKNIYAVKPSPSSALKSGAGDTGDKSTQKKRLAGAKE